MVRKPLKYLLAGVASAVLLAHGLLGTAAWAQNINLMPDAPPPDPATQERREAVDRAYRDTQRKIQPAASGAVDPWGNIREPAKPAPPKNADNGAPKKKPAQ